MRRLVLTVPQESSGIRLDVFLADRIPDQSRATVQKWIRELAVLHNGAPGRPSTRVRDGDIILAEIPDPPPDERLVPWDLPLHIVFEDDHLLAVNKPSGLVTHPGPGNRTGTLANALMAARPSIAGAGHPLRPGIVHRLDKETSGILLVAKSSGSYVRLSRMFHDREVVKHYRALALGRFQKAEGRVEQALGRDPFNRQKVSVRAGKSRNATTLYSVLRQHDFGALLDVQILTGRTHQIRVHLSFLNHPVVGDLKYGGGNWNRIREPILRDRLRKAHFFGLHAFSLDLKHPVTNVPLHLEAPLPSIWGEFI